jgi:hypothetical protein
MSVVVSENDTTKKRRRNEPITKNNNNGKKRLSTRLKPNKYSDRLSRTSGGPVSLHGMLYFPSLMTVDLHAAHHL